MSGLSASNRRVSGPVGARGPPPGARPWRRVPPACDDAPMRILINLVVNAIAIWVASEVVQGVTLEGDDVTEKAIGLVLVAAVFGLVNTFIKPLVKLVALPLFILTLGLITFVVNALMLLLTSWISDRIDVGFNVEDFFWSAVLGALVISVVSWLLNVILPDD
jgi:putative membrane protein